MKVTIIDQTEKVFLSSLKTGTVFYTEPNDYVRDYYLITNNSSVHSSKISAVNIDTGIMSEFSKNYIVNAGFEIEDITLRRLNFR